jgi:non-specific serine/threonine protein kinase
LDGHRSSSNFEPRTSNSTLDVLAGLVDKSLVVAEPTHPGGARYRFLETVRAYAAEHLAHATAEEADAQRCHAQYFRALAERAEPELIGPGQSAWLRRLEPDYSNVRAALAWARARGEWDEGLRLAGALCIFWMFANHLREGHDFLATFLTQARAPAPVRLKALWTAGYLAFHLGEQGTEQSPSPWARGLALAREIGPPGEIARFLAGVGSEAVVRGDSDRACALLEEALTLARQQGNAWIEHAATMWLGLLHWCTGEFEQARYRLEEALALSRIVADARHTANTLITLADVVLLQGDAAQAAALAQESLIERGALGDAWSVGITLVIMARVAVAYSQYERAARLLGAADGLRTSIGAAFELPGRWRTDARCARDATRAALNAATLDTIWTEGQAMSLEDATAYAQAVDLPAPATDRAPTEGPASPLTRREREVVTLIARGLTNAQIATVLIISERTVDTHAEHIRAKLDVRSRAEIAAWAARHNLTELPTA